MKPKPTATRTTHPTHSAENPFDVGQRDAQAGRPINANPYRYGTIHWSRWNSGWNWNTTAKRKAA